MNAGSTSVKLRVVDEDDGVTPIAAGDDPANALLGNVKLSALGSAPSSPSPSSSPSRAW